MDTNTDRNRRYVIPFFFFNESLPERLTEYPVESRAVTWDATEMSHDCKLLLL